MRCRVRRGRGARYRRGFGGSGRFGGRGGLRGLSQFSMDRAVVGSGQGLAPTAGAVFGDGFALGHGRSIIRARMWAGRDQDHETYCVLRHFLTFHAFCHEGTKSLKKDFIRVSSYPCRVNRATSSLCPVPAGRDGLWPPGLLPAGWRSRMSGLKMGSEQRLSRGEVRRLGPGSWPQGVGESSRRPPA